MFAFAAAVVVVACLVMPRSALASTTARTNIVIVHPDDMIAAYTAFASAPTAVPGTSHPVAPSAAIANMQKIRDEGISFTRAYTASGMCSPSRHALITGRWPSRNVQAEKRTRNSKGSGVRTQVSVPPSVLTDGDKTENIASVLSRCGYETGVVGKWHVSEGTGANYGDTYAQQQAAVKACGFNFADGIYISNLNTCTSACDGFSHNNEWVTEKALEFMNNAISQSRPFFLYFNPTVPHSPLAKEVLNPSSADQKYTDVATPAGTLSSSPSTATYCASCQMPSRAQVWSMSSGFTGKDRSMVASVGWIDASVGVIYNFLEARGVLDNTLFIVTSDNGYAKGSAFEEGIRTTLIARGPGIPAGSSSSALVSNIDLLATTLDFANVDKGNYDTDGVSWKTDAQSGGSVGNARSVLFAEMCYDRVAVGDRYKVVSQPGGTLSNSDASTTIRSGYPSWGTAEQVYDLLDDGAEQTDISSSTGSVSAVNLLKTALADHDAATINRPVSSATSSTVCLAVPSPSPSSSSASSGQVPSPGSSSPSPSPSPSLSPSPGALSPTPNPFSGGVPAPLFPSPTSSSPSPSSSSTRTTEPEIAEDSRPVAAGINSVMAVSAAGVAAFVFICACVYFGFGNAREKGEELHDEATMVSRSNPTRDDEWKVAYTGDGRPYYFNDAGETKW